LDEANDRSITVKILIIGGDGMLGHELLQHLSTTHDARVTLRGGLSAYEPFRMFNTDNAYDGIDVQRPESVRAVITDFCPDAIVNAAAIVKQRPEANNSIPVIEVNALFPHQLELMARSAGSRVVQISTDCVFSGTRGYYAEDDVPDPVDLYGRTKLLGELVDGRAVTLRTSMIGLELTRRIGLVEWALAQSEAISGYRRVPYNGLTTMEFARVLELVLTRHSALTGVWHVSTHSISKHDLLVRLFELLDEPIEVKPDDAVACDRTLRSDRFRAATGWEPPTWEQMLPELADRIRARGNQR
jgi:dTDP-4-dehydrorhamnose reductase